MDGERTSAKLVSSISIVLLIFVFIIVALNILYLKGENAAFQRLRDAREAKRVEDFKSILKEIISLYDNGNLTNSYTKIGEWVNRKVSEDGYNIMSPVERVAFCVYSLQTEIHKSNFSQYFDGPSGYMAHEALHALEEINALKTRDILGKAISVFPAKRVSQNPAIRSEIVRKLTKQQRELLNTLDEKFRERPDNLEKLVVEYFLANQ